MSEHTASSPTNDEVDSSPDFLSCPPIFVLPTHLSLESLHEIEEDLVKRNARLTYDISEARLILGKIGQEKRAALELRSRGVWTEPISKYEPPTKRRRVEAQEPVKSARQDDIIDLSTETEDEEDGMRSRHGPSRHLNRPKPPSASASTPHPSIASSDQSDVISVVKLDWLNQCLQAQELLSIEPYLVYLARQIPSPAKPQPNQPTKTTTKSADILQRAKQDAVLQPPPPPPTHNHHSRTHTTHQPPPLPQTTTSEHDEVVSPHSPPPWVKNNIIYACLRSTPLHPPNEDFINQLLKIRHIRELTLDEIGVRAYSTSIAAIAAYPHEIRRSSEILSLPGCDTKIANLFHEYQHSANHTLATANELDISPSLQTLHTFTNIWGVGTKTARDFHYNHNWTTLDDIIEHGWPTLSRVQQIGLKYYDEFLQGIPRPETSHIAAIVTKHANRVRPDAGTPIQCAIVGGYRRGKPLCGDVDLILTHRDEHITKNLVVDVVASLESEGWITHTLVLHLMHSQRDQQTLPYRASDDSTAPGKNFDTLDKALVVWQDPHFDDSDHHHHHSHADTDSEEEKTRQKRKRNPNIHHRVDIIVSPWRTVGCAVLGWTGDKTFERDLRRYVKKTHGWKFDSSGVRERTTGGQVVDLEAGGETWEERERLVMQGLGLGWRDPEERCTR
ncbi:Nucleotidyltransferase [Aspergillus ellipticus CBS 707.79]|uniref:DNA polymerase n=1 Tax=Aspergillus ellipticus CBS 707.79 TaxID=1448320 RepID=A0A319D3G7_9EURO|nr:Nucleotidyltransferase [Aspergillus ellipticus CBS 707.79]